MTFPHSFIYSGIRWQDILRCPRALNYGVTNFLLPEGDLRQFQISCSKVPYLATLEHVVRKEINCTFSALGRLGGKKARYVN